MGKVHYEPNRSRDIRLGSLGHTGNPRKTSSSKKQGNMRRADSLRTAGRTDKNLKYYLRVVHQNYFGFSTRKASAVQAVQ